MMSDIGKLWDRLLKVVAVGIATTIGVLVVVFYLHRAGKLQPLEIFFYDEMIRLHLQPREMQAADDVVIVGLDEFDLRLLHHYPIYDGDKKTLLDDLEKTGAVAIGMDIYMDIQTGDVPKSTTDLHKLLWQDKNIVCGYFLGNGSAADPEVRPPEGIGPLTSSRLVGRRIGCLDQRADIDVGENDGVCRRGVLYLSDNGTVGEVPALESLSAGVANRFLEADGTLSKPESGSKDTAHFDTFWSKRLPRFSADCGGYVNADAGGFQYLLDYRGPTKFPIYRLRQIVDFDHAELEALPAYAKLPKVGDDAFKGKVVLVGMTCPSVKDLITTPLNRGWDHYGVEQHAVMVDQLIRTAHFGSRSIIASSSASIWTYTVFWAILGTFAGLMARYGYSPNAPWRLVFIAIFGQLLLLGFSALCFRYAYWLPVVPASFCWLTTLAIVGSYVAQIERTDRNILNNLFVKICQAEIATELWQRRDEIIEDGRLKPKRLGATFMFTDLRGFSSECERIDPYLIMSWLNHYHDTMTAIVTRYHGVVVKYMGDGMMAVFGAPRSTTDAQLRPQDATNAVNCALEMRKKMLELHQEWKNTYLPCLPMRIGIQSGTVIEGSLSSANRMEYVTVSDTVNVASRLENWNKKEMGFDITADVCRIIIGQSTWELVQGQFICRKFPDIKLDGRTALMDLYGVTVENQAKPPTAK